MRDHCPWFMWRIDKSIAIARSSLQVIPHRRPSSFNQRKWKRQWPGYYERSILEDCWPSKGKGNLNERRSIRPSQYLRCIQGIVNWINVSSKSNLWTGWNQRCQPIQLGYKLISYKWITLNTNVSTFKMWPCVRLKPPPLKRRGPGGSSRLTCDYSTSFNAHDPIPSLHQDEHCTSHFIQILVTSV